MNTNNAVFIGPVTTLTTTASQSIVASGGSSLGTSSGTADSAIAICVSPTGANTPTLLDPNPGSATTGVTVTTTQATYSASQTGTPGAGTWDVGMCSFDFSGTTPIDKNDWSVGYAFVVNGTTSSELKKNASSHNR